MKYWEEEFNISTNKDLKFRFKKMSPIDILAISNDIEMYAGNNDSEVYKKYLIAVLENTEVKINNSWLPVKEGGNYYPAYIQDDIRGLREIVNKFFVDVIKPIFIDSSGSTNEQK